jgi:hypothetical protein
MREEIVVDVAVGETLQVTINNQPKGRALSIPAGTRSVTVIVLDTDKLNLTRAARKDKVKARRNVQREKRRAREAKRLGIAKPSKR